MRDCFLVSSGAECEARSKHIRLHDKPEAAKKKPQIV